MLVLGQFETFEGTCTVRDIFNKLDSKLREEGLSWKNCISVCTDGAGAMQGTRRGLKAKVLEVVVLVVFVLLFCFLYIFGQ